MNMEEGKNASDRELFSELFENPIHPLFIHMVPPFVASVRCFETTNVAWSKVNNVRYMAVQLDHANSNSVFF